MKLNIRPINNYERAYPVDIYNELDSTGMQMLKDFLFNVSPFNPLLELPLYNAYRFDYPNNNKVVYMLYSPFKGYNDIYIEVNLLENNITNYTFRMSKLYE